MRANIMNKSEIELSHLCVFLTSIACKLLRQATKLDRMTFKGIAA